jgi:hypothetical protein
MSKKKETAKKKKLQEAKDAIADLKNKSVADGKAVIENLKDLRNVNIADISFAYRNKDLLIMLRQRGIALNSLDFAKVDEIEKEIDRLKKENYDDWTRPESCFIVFEADDAKETAEEADGWNDDAPEDKKYKILGGKINFRLHDISSEPTDIIWENRYNTKFDIAWRTAVAVIASILLMILSFFILYYISLVLTYFTVMFPTIKCNPIIRTYGENLERYAYRDFLSA